MTNFRIVQLPDILSNPSFLCRIISRNLKLTRYTHIDGNSAIGTHVRSDICFLALCKAFDYLVTHLTFSPRKCLFFFIHTQQVLSYHQFSSVYIFQRSYKYRHVNYRSHSPRIPGTNLWPRFWWGFFF